MQFPNIPKSRKLVILGDSLFAEVAYECFTRDSEYDVVGFAVEQAYLRKDRLFGLPVVPIEQMSDYFPPREHDVYAAIIHTQLNRLRARLANAAERRGYRLASYVSSHAMVWPNAKLGKHCFIFMNNVVQPFATIGDNVVLWNTNIVGHHATVRDHVFVTGQVVIPGSCDIGSNCFLGVNTAMADGVTIGQDCFINLGTMITRSLEANKMYRGQPAKPYCDDAREFFKVVVSS